MLRYKLASCKKSLPLLITINLSTIFLLPLSPSLAETSPVPSPSDAPLELALLTQPNGDVITANTINPEGLTTPSLWWEKENSENKLLDNWIGYPANEQEPARVDLIVNQQIWSLLDYLERYDFVNRLGSSARKDGYNVRVFNYQQNLLATYTCNFVTSPISCRIQINTQNRLGLLRSF
ncbi:hypothetical protein PN465_05245 [Nodularia spumigena CS-584]|jgi:hypothetical protein|uniref:Uncharacterized protein n=2 Tax=Nodularia spumigena TaxID=70799 RepID=A0ABU5ULA6_NODSP|nr:MULTISPECIES: hypothetical protein [Cyanophyceae]AHJ29275.1 hypothetical protein NSP_29480 [Nodularia spumigena CCY9414]MDB9339596.1 hypothetical protein [Nodularia spumigena CS-589/07]MDB9381634.1 hypothetical protein [Nodularia spumigena CS-584]MDB9401523.1 hypothetical protein [Microcystis aeruginosa CS-567/02-A1]MDB9497093.1 hypothetical protein [Nodularia spumigena CS-336/02]